MKQGSFLLVLACVLSLASLARADAPPQVLMGALGDSLTVAAVADMALPEQSPEPGPEIGEPPSRDEVERRVIWDNRETLSWSTGKEIASHFKRLGEHLKAAGDPARLVMLNVAENGNKAEQIPGQAQKIVDAMATGQYRELAYVTLLVGANDACSSATEWGTPPEKFKQGILDALGKLATIRQEHPVRVLVSLTPPVAELGQERIRKARTLFNMTCTQIRSEVFNMCRRDLVDWTDEAGHLHAQEIVRRKNDEIRAAVNLARIAYPQLEIALSQALPEFKLETGILAADCFHPNARGQGVVAELLWADQPWFR